MDQQLQRVWADPQHDDWAGLGARLRHFVAEVSQRQDLVVRIEPLLDKQARLVPRGTFVAAMFVPAEARVHIRAQAPLDSRWDDPATIDPADRFDQADFPALMGVAVHEAGHAAHTSLEFPVGTPARECTWAMLLEEARMEGAVVSRRPDLAKWLRVMVADVVSDGALQFRLGETGADPAESAFRAAILFVARHLAGILTEEDVRLLREDVAAVITDDVLNQLESLLSEAVAVADDDLDALLDVTRRVLDLLDQSPGHENQNDDDQDEDAQDQGQEEGSAGGQGQGAGGQGNGQGDTGGPGEDGQHGEPGDGHADAADDQQDAAVSDPTPSPGTDQNGDANGNAQQLPCGSWTVGDLDDGLDPETETPVPDQAGDLDDNIDRRAQDTAGRASAAARRQIAEDNTTPGDVPAPSPEAQAAQDAEEAATREATRAWQSACGTSATQIRTQDKAPEPALREQARSLTATLRRAQYRAVTRSTRAALLPPGRMRMVEEVRRRGQVSAHARQTAKPYRQTRRRETPDPPLLVGFAGDVSASMTAWQQVTANLAWALAHATRHVNGTIAAVAWNGGTRTTLRPGASPAQVQVATCGGGSTGCPSAIAALDGALGLAHAEDAARVLVIVTDGVIGDTRQPVAEKVNRLAQRGVKVLWVTPRPDHLCDHARNVVLTSPDQFGATIGAAIADVLADT